MDNCIFCKIIKGEIPCYKIYEDEFTLAFLDIANDHYGHTLVIPKQHCENVLDCNNESLNHVIQTVKTISNHYVNNLGFDGVNILNANGKAAEQSVFHLHFHIMPRKHNDKKHMFPSLEKQNFNLEEIANRLKINN